MMRSPPRTSPTCAAGRQRRGRRARAWRVRGGDGHVARCRSRRHEPAAGIVIELAPVPVAPGQAGERCRARPREADVRRLAQQSDRDARGKDRGEGRAEGRGQGRAESRREAIKPVEEPPPEVRRRSIRRLRSSRPPQQEVKQETPQRQEPRPPAPPPRRPRWCRRRRRRSRPRRRQARTPKNFRGCVTWKSSGRPRCSSATSATRRRPSRAREQGVAQVSSVSIGRGAWSTAVSCAPRARPRSTRRRSRCCAASAAAEGRFHGRACGYDRADPLQSQPEVKVMAGRRSVFRRSGDRFAAENASNARKPGQLPFR